MTSNRLFRYKSLKAREHIRVLSFLVATLCTLSPAITQAQEAHVHGLANLNIVIEGDKLEVLFESPAANLVGFEHKARSDQELQSLVDTEAKLNDTSSLIGFIGTECKTLHKTIDLSAIAQEKHGAKAASHQKHDEHSSHHGNDKHHDHEEHNKHDEHDKHSSHHDNEKHDGQHGHEKHDKHESHAHEDHDEHVTHSEVQAQYQFACKDLTKLEAIEVELFKLFPGIEKINSIWISDAGQGSSTLHRGKNKVSMR